MTQRRATEEPKAGVQILGGEPTSGDVTETPTFPVGAALDRSVALSLLTDDDLYAMFTPLLASCRHAVLAVSGGPDSLALMRLAARWIASGRAPSGFGIDVATVDHGLRSESSREADWVAGQARALGLTHTTLVWSGEKPTTGVQAQAREARYALLAAHASRRAPAAVVTAHTSDDQAETLIMRLGRGSGLDGLAGMAPVRPLLPDGSVQLVRPLLGISKRTLVAMLVAEGASWLEDPSNERHDFERVRIRAAEQQQAKLGLTNEKLALSAHRLQRARGALEAVAEERLAALVDDHAGAFASLDLAQWLREPSEIRIRILGRLLKAFGGDAMPAQLSQIEALDAALAESTPTTQTLGGCIVSKGRTTLRLYREPGHRELPHLMLNPGEEIRWDWRFRIRYSIEVPDAGDTVDQADMLDQADTVGQANTLGKADAVSQADDASEPPEPVLVRPLGLKAYATLRSTLPMGRRIPARAAAGLPSVWRGDTLLAVPALPGAIAGDWAFSAQFLGLRRDMR